MIIDRYLTKNVLSGVFVTLLALLGVGFFFTFLSQIHNVGTGSFTTSTALLYAALTLPQDAYDMFPVAVLIGALFALGRMAEHDELIMFRVAGASVIRLTWALMGAAIFLAIFVTLIGEFVAPPAKRIAETVRVERMYAMINTLGPGGLWIKSGSDVVHVLKVESTRNLRGIIIYDVGRKQKLVSVRRAKSARYRNGHWILRDVRGTTFLDGKTNRVLMHRQVWGNFVAPSTFRVLIVDPSNLSWRGLLRYLHYLRKNGLATQRYVIAFWHKAAVPVAAMFMLLLALPFSLGQARTSGTGQRLAIGVALGLLYYLVDRVLLDAGAAFRIPAVLAAWSPTVLLAVGTCLFLRRAGKA